MSVVGTYFIEIATPLFFFLPVRSLRLLGFWSHVSQADACMILYSLSMEKSLKSGRVMQHRSYNAFLFDVVFKTTAYL